jgi:hypothetical protein
MTNKFCINFLVIMLFCYCSVVNGDEKNNNNITGIYSNMFYNEEGGDLVGFEMFILMGGEDYYVIYQESEGAPSVPIVVEAKINGNIISFTITEPTGKEGKFIGKISAKYLIGKFEGEENQIKLTKKKSYWQ